MLYTNLNRISKVRMNTIRIAPEFYRFCGCFAELTHQSTQTLSFRLLSNATLFFKTIRLGYSVSITNKTITTNTRSFYFPQQPFDSFLAAEGTTTGLAPLLPGWTEAFLINHTALQHLLLHDFSSHGHESSLDVGTVLGRSLHKLNTKRISKFLGSFIRNDLLSSEISLVTDKQLDDILISITVNFMKPSLDVVERVLISDIVNNNNAMSSTIVGRGNSTETLLTSSIPLPIRWNQQKLTICNFTVLPSRSTVRIFYAITKFDTQPTKSTPIVVI